jgi:hypothetical protein
MAARRRGRRTKEIPVKSWFLYDPAGDGFVLYETASEAREAALSALELERDAAATDIWSEEVASICWGSILEAAVEVAVNDPDVGRGDVDKIIDYQLLPVVSAAGNIEAEPVEPISEFLPKTQQP